MNQLKSLTADNQPPNVLFYLSNSYFPSSRANTLQVTAQCIYISLFVKRVVLVGQAPRYADYSFRLLEHPLDISSFPNLVIPTMRRAARPFGTILFIIFSLFNYFKLFLSEAKFVCYGRHIEAIILLVLVNKLVFWRTVPPPILELHDDSILNNRCLKLLISCFVTRNYLKIATISHSLNKVISSGLNLHLNKHFSPITTLPLSSPFPLVYSRISEKDKHFLTDSIDVIYLGSSHPGKGSDFFINLAKTRSYKASFHYVGYNKDLEALSQSFIVYHGQLSYESCAALLSHSKIGLIPASNSILIDGITDIGEYTSPLKLFDYMASSTAIIASNTCALSEVLENNVNSILLPQDDPIQWHHAIEKLLKNNVVRKNLAANAYLGFHERYSYRIRSEKILNLFYN